MLNESVRLILHYPSLMQYYNICLTKLPHKSCHKEQTNTRNNGDVVIGHLSMWSGMMLIVLMQHMESSCQSLCLRHCSLK